MLRWVLASLVGFAVSVAPPGALRRIDVPAPSGSGMYSLAASRGGDVYLGWLEPALAGHAFKFSRLEPEGWSAPRTIATGTDWFVNWADHPSLAVLDDGSLVAHWLVNNPGKAGSYGYGIRIAQSRDGGTSWREIFAAGTEDESDYSGFVSLLPTERGFSAAYLTPARSSAPAAAAVTDHASARHDVEHVKALKVAHFGLDGTLLGDDVVDEDVCTCCPTSLVATDGGALLAYRDHRGPIRDIAVVRLGTSGWSAPTPLHHDGWAINGCPTNGPVLASKGADVAAAWFTAAGDIPRVQVAFSTDAGRRFGEPVVVDGGKPVGWPAIIALDDGALVGWLESTGNGRGEIRLRRVWRDGRRGAPYTVAESQGGRSTGVIQMVRSGASVVVAWRTDRVETAVVMSGEF